MIRFDASLYNRGAVMQAVEDYREIAEIAVRDRDGFCECELLRSQAEKELVELEFGNYVLNLSVMMEGNAIS